MKFFYLAIAVLMISTNVSAKVDPVVLVDTKEMFVFAKVDPKPLSAQSVPFIQNGIAEVKKYLTAKKVKNVTSAVTYTDNKSTYAGFLVGAAIPEEFGYKLVKIPAGKALKATVRGPLTEVPEGYKAAALKFKSMKNLKDLNQTLELYVSPAGTPPAQIITELYFFMQVAK
jgi:hypothetical protein